MYDQFYQFKAEPFRLSPDHAFAYAHKGYVKARAYMAYAFLRAEGFVMITGRPGTGKTTLVGALVDQLATENVSVANLVCTQLQADDLLKLVAYEFGIASSVVEKGELLQRLTQLLKSGHRDGRRALLIVDEAQDLSVSAMEELRLLTNIQVDGRPLLQIFLLGQPELRDLVLSPALEQVHQRIVAASHLRPLQLDETEAYIRHRLEVVGWREDPAISKAIYPLVHKYSEGIPRRINLICSRLLLQCAVEQRHRVDLADLKEVLKELQEESLAAGSSFSEADFQGIEEDEADEEAPAQRSPEPVGQSGEMTEAALAEQPDAPPRESADSGGGTVHNSRDSTAELDSTLEAFPAEDAVRGRQHLKVVAGGGGRVSALRTGTNDSSGVAVEPQEIGVTAFVLDEAPAPDPVSARGPAVHDESPERADSEEPDRGRRQRRADNLADVANDRNAQLGHAPAPGAGHHTYPQRSKRKTQPSSRGKWGAGGIGELLVILVFAVAVVVWAASGFEL